jgi:hypothetical protein
MTAAALAALVLTAAIGAASASATVLCKTASTVCQPSDVYGSGTEISASLRSGTKAVFKTTGGETWSSRSQGSMKFQTTDSGGEGKGVGTKDTSYTLSECTWVTSFPTYGTGAITYSGSGNGTFYHGETIIRMIVFGLTCNYTFPYVSEVKGGSSATVAANGTASRAVGSSLSCPTSLQMSAEYTVSSPAALYVEERGVNPVVLCNANEEHCAEANRYGTGTKVTAALKAGSSFKLEETGSEGEVLDNCTSSALGGETTSAGGASSDTVGVDISSASFSGCSWSTVPVALPWHTTIRRGTSGNGTQTLSGFAVEVRIPFFGKCLYGGSPTFTVTGGSGAELSANKVKVEKLAGSSVTCPSQALLSATYVLSSPSPLYVTAP